MDQRFRVGEWQVRPDLGTITRGDDSIRLEPKVMEVLVYLADHGREVLPKERIIQAVWADTFVTDEVLTNAVSSLRKAFGDDPKHPAYIETLPRRGYRLVARVREVGSSPMVPTAESPDAPPPESRWGRRLGMLVASAVLLVIVAGLYLRPSPDLIRAGDVSADRIDSIAVLPFRSIGEDPETHSLADAIPAFISSSLARLEQLSLVKPSSLLERYKGERIDPKVVAEEQGVIAVLTGSVERRGDAVAVNVELVDGRTSALIWGQPYRREFSGVFEIEDDIARQVLQGLRIKLTETQDRRLGDRGTRNPKAYEAFTMAKYHLTRWAGRHVKEHFAPALPYLEKATREDSGYQEAYYVLGNVYFIFGRNYYDSSPEDFRRAREHWEKLIAVDDSTAWAHQTRARILWQYEQDWTVADRAYRKALELEPASEIPYYKWFLEWMGRHEEVAAIVETKLRRADPESPTAQGGLAWNLLWAREYDRAITQAQHVLEFEPEWIDPYVIISFAHELQGEEGEAFEAALNALEAQGADRDRLKEAHEAFERSGMAGVRALSRYHHQDSPTSPRPVNLAMESITRGNLDGAFQWLEKSWTDPLWGSENAPSSPFLDPLRSDPRFEQLLRKLNLPEEAIARHLKGDY